MSLLLIISSGNPHLRKLLQDFHQLAIEKVTEKEKSVKATKI
jgi:hypothetical protein